MTQVIEQDAFDIPKGGELTEIRANVYWLRMPLPMRLDHINLYLIDEGDGWTLVDTGMRLEPTETLWKEMQTTVFKDKPLKQVLVTHFHPDHIGMAGWLCEQHQCPLLMSALEYYGARAYIAGGKIGWEMHKFVKSCGLGQDYLDYLGDTFSFGRWAYPLPMAFERLEAGDTLHLGGSDWQVYLATGHSMAHVCLYNKQQQILIGGDQLLPKISPNVSVLATEPKSSPMQTWLQSLEQFKQCDPGTLVLPAHNRPFLGLHARVDELVKHHYDQGESLVAACENEHTAAELLKPLFGREIQLHEMGLAMGECKAHLHWLCDRQLLESEERDGVVYYKTVV